MLFLFTPALASVIVVLALALTQHFTRNSNL